MIKGILLVALVLTGCQIEPQSSLLAGTGSSAVTNLGLEECRALQAVIIDRARYGITVRSNGQDQANLPQCFGGTGAPTQQTRLSPPSSAEEPECARCTSSGAADCHAQCMPSSTFGDARPPGPEEIHVERRGSSYYVPVRINDTITLPFLLDTGAGDLAIPADIARTLIRAGALRGSDRIGNRPYQMANGSEEISPVVAIREVRVGEHVVRNVTAAITPANGDPLLGQSFLSKFGAVTIDYNRGVLVLSR